LETCVYDLT
jgi:5-oxoprolinase (ATP-hydrolysing)